MFVDAVSYAPKVAGGVAGVGALPTAGESVTSHWPVDVGKQGFFEDGLAISAAPAAAVA